MGVPIAVQSCITTPQRRRGLLEGTRLANRIKDERTGKLLMDATR